jgi:sarcosine oxidase subunit gamma
MAEPARAIEPTLRRRFALDEGPRSRQGVSIAILPPAARFSLRLPIGAGAAAREIAGFRLGAPINRYEAAGDRWSARLGPNEWLIGGPESDGELIATEVEAALGGASHALTDVSHRNVGIEISGVAAAAVLNAGCPLDLSTKAFPGGSVTRTVLAKAEIVLVRAETEPVFRVECWRSFAPYVHAFLIEGSRDFPALARDDRASKIDA